MRKVIFKTKRGGSLVSSCFSGESKWKFTPTGVAALSQVVLVRKVSRSLHQKGGSLAASSFGVNLRLLLQCSIVMDFSVLV